LWKLDGRVSIALWYRFADVSTGVAHQRVHLVPPGFRSVAVARFATWEQPELFSRKIRAAFRSLR
jgi:hypothetical protein